MNNSNQLLKVIANRIKQDGPLNVAQYMELCLLHPDYGYYTTKDPFGELGDFITAPEISSVFGEFVCGWLLNYWLNNHSSDEFQIVEIGAGRGFLMLDMLRLINSNPIFHGKFSIHIVEPSPKLQLIQRENIQQNSSANHIQGINWHQSINEIPSGSKLLLANELLDALPVRQYIYCPTQQHNTWQERVITLKNEDFSHKESPQFTWDQKQISASDVPPDLFAAVASSDLAHNEYYFEFSEQSLALATEIAKQLKGNSGAALFIDYGDNRKFKGWSLQALIKHQKTDPLLYQGNADLTAHADFYYLEQAAKHQEIEFLQPIKQGNFLTKLGIEQRINSLKKKHPSRAEEFDRIISKLTHEREMGNLFKVSGITYKDKKIRGENNSIYPFGS